MESQKWGYLAKVKVWYLLHISFVVGKERTYLHVNQTTAFDFQWISLNQYLNVNQNLNSLRVCLNLLRPSCALPASIKPLFWSKYCPCSVYIFFVDVIGDNLYGHGGSIQAAIIFDFPTEHVTHFDLLIEGLNGQLPNLDVINLVFQIGRFESVPIKFAHQVNICFCSKFPEDNQIEVIWFFAMITVNSGFLVNLNLRIWEFQWHRIHAVI